MTAVPCRVTFRGLHPSRALTMLIQERAAWLRQFSSELTNCHALIDSPHRHRHEHAVRVQLRLALRESGPLTIDREGVGDPYALVRDIFDIARRRLQDAIREQRGFVKAHTFESQGGLL